MCFLQIRRALLQLLFPGKPFHWLRHIAIAMCLLFIVNLLVILVPNIRDIFGITGGVLDLEALPEPDQKGAFVERDIALVKSHFK